MGFTDTFGGSPVSPAEVSFKAYTQATNLFLVWPQFSAGNPNVAARFMNISMTAATKHVVLPDATLVTVGQDNIIFNAGTNSFTVLDTGSNEIAVIAPGQTYYILLIDNTTTAGAWQTLQFGVGTGSASAAALAGNGLIAAGGLLNVNLNATTANGDYTIDSTARAVLQAWTGGVGVITLPTATSVGDGFFFPFANDGTGSVTIMPTGDLIDGSTSSVFTQTQSAFIISSGGAWYTVGKGTQTNFAVTILNLNVTGSSNVTETSSQAQNIIQQFTGILTGNINVIVPSTVQLYYVFNNTSGAFTLTFKTSAGTGITIDQGSHSIVYCDGTNVLNAFTSTFGGAISVSGGSPTSPNINFIGSGTTGIYSPAVGQLGITANAKAVATFISDASAINYLQLESTATGNAPVISAQGGDTNIGIILSPKGAGAVGIAKVLIIGGTIDGTIIGATTAAAITGTTITGTSFVGPLTGNAATATALQTPRTINGVNFDGTANITVTAAAGTLTGTTLASNVISSSLTSTGVLTSGSTGAGFTVALTTSTITGVLPSANGGAGAINGILKANGSGVVSLAIVGTDYVTGSSTNTLTNKTFDTAGTGNSFSINGVAITANTGTGNNVLSVSPALTGTPTAPTATVGTNTTQVATTAFVQAAAHSAQLAIAWGSFEGSTGTLLKGFNVTSVTRNAVGSYTINLTSPAADTNYSVNLTIVEDGVISGTNGTYIINDGSIARTTSAIGVRVVLAGSISDPTRVNFVIFD